MNPSADTLIAFGHDVTFHASFPPGGGIACQVQWGTVTLVQATLGPGHRTASANFDSQDVRAHGEIDADFTAGEVSWTVQIDVRDAVQNPPVWTTVVDVTDAVLVSYDPCTGMVRGNAEIAAPVVLGPWGPSHQSGRGVTRIHIADEARVLTDVGQLAKAELFPDYRPFTFNVVACCGKPTGPADGPGVYADPTSVWFNVFFGIYQLDCAKADGWDRPFGYQSDAGVASLPHEEDLVRLGKADWNWFSNYLYGVPKAVCQQYSTIGKDEGAVTRLPTATIGTSAWHESTMSGVEVVSGYQSDAPGAAQLEMNTLLTPFVQRNFGLPCPRPDHPTSFIPTTLVASQLMSYWQDDTAFHTLVFGGTSQVQTDPAFLDAQTAAVKTLMAASFADAGFPLS